MKIRSGIGYDAHRFAEKRKLILCGVDIPYEKGLLGYSDADAPLHALTDALLGCVNAGDIGKLFPDTDPAFKDADSLELLRKAFSLPVFAGWEISSIDLIIIAQAPKIGPYAEQMKKNIARALHCPEELISIKGKTTEKMGFCGRGEGIETFANVLLINNQETKG